MKHPVIVCVDDQREVLATLLKDLEPFARHVDLVPCDSGDEALGVIDDEATAGTPVAVVITDHVMPGMTGVDLLAKVEADPRLACTRRLLLTGLATHADTVDAINRARVDRYIAKPWQPEALRAAVRTLLTRFLVQSDLPVTGIPVALLDADELIRGRRHAGQ